MYKNYVFDLYGTLVDIRTNEEKVYLWDKLTELFGFYGAIYTRSELKKRYCLENSHIHHLRDTLIRLRNF